MAGRRRKRNREGKNFFPKCKSLGWNKCTRIEVVENAPSDNVEPKVRFLRFNRML